MNLKSDNRIACLIKEEEPFCGDGIVQVNILIFKSLIPQINLGWIKLESIKINNSVNFQGDEECDCGTIFQCVAARSCCSPPEGKGKRENACRHDSSLRSSCAK